MDPGNPPPVPRTAAHAARRRRWWSAGAGVVAAAVAVGTVAVVTSGDASSLEEGSIRLEPVDAQTPDPFTDEDVDLGDVVDGERQVGGIPVPSGTEAAALSDEIATGLSGKVAVGDQPGLHAGSQTAAICDVAALAELLTDPANADRARAWAGVHGIEAEDIPGFLDDLTPVRLRYDTRVTNHGFRDGRAIPYQSILQAGTAVLVDHRGVPRARCSCGNPLTPPTSVDDADEPDDGAALDLARLAANPGDAWEDLDPADVVTIEPGEEREPIVVADLQTGQHVEQLSGITYTIDQLAAALPRDAELDRSYDDIERCPQGDDPREAEQAAASCSGPEGSHQYAGVTARTEGTEEMWGNGGLFLAEASTWTDPRARTQWFQEARSSQEEYDGRYDIPPSDRPGDAFEAGMRGEGAIEDFELGGWTGFVKVATHSLVSPDGETSPPLSEAAIYVTRGNALMWIAVVRPDEDAAAARDALEQYATQIFEALP